MSSVVLLLMLVWVLMKLLDTGAQVNKVSDGVVSLMQPTVIDFKRLPVFRNGTEYGFGLWLYLNEIPRRAEPTPVLTANGIPLFSISEHGSSIDVQFPVSESKPAAQAEFRHVSVKRWVHLLAVHNDGAINLFKDGELVSVDTIPATQIEQPSGPIRLGDMPADAYVSSAVFLNHFPDTKLVKAMYKSGPQATNKVFQAMGFSNFGVRSPIYKITES